MCGNEPCRHERAGASDEILGFDIAHQAFVKVEAERDEANVQLDKIRQLCTEADTDGQDVPVSVLRSAIEAQP